MEPKKRMKASLPPHDLAVRPVGVLTFVLGLISLFSKLRPAAIGITPWLGAAWLAWAIPGLGIFSYRQWSAIDRGYAARQTRRRIHRASLDLQATWPVC
ncbi:hypothetical protein ACFFJT_10655 [Dyella flava]|uniref:Uncharacterized protein n=1 Tax=Dyella flava TaxID=1920170 RepID=A0ABS2JY47_9GAMM|nr:hypothetical protein [Dyella flava]MBM7123899.1 hypothetical protein [Dyella flava]GLQ52573.1 hypothetical protein GCM10010872_40220 [Dyella flava]